MTKAKEIITDSDGNKFVLFEGDGFSHKREVLRQVGEAKRNGRFFPLFELTDYDRECFPWAEFRLGARGCLNQADYFHFVTLPARRKPNTKRVIEYDMGEDDWQKTLSLESMSYTEIRLFDRSEPGYAKILEGVNG
jgi:hypothetical protein